MRHAGNIVALVHQEMKKVICEGISTFELDKIANEINSTPVHKKLTLFDYTKYNSYKNRNKNKNFKKLF